MSARSLAWLGFAPSVPFTFTFTKNKKATPACEDGTVTDQEFAGDAHICDNKHTWLGLMVKATDLREQSFSSKCANTVFVT